MARLMPLTTTMGSTPRCGISGSMPDNLPACFLAPRVTFRVTLRTAFRAVAAVPGFARLVRDFAADDLPRDLAVADFARADFARVLVLVGLALAAFARDFAAAGFARREAAPALARRVAGALRTAGAARLAVVLLPAAFLAVTLRVDFFFATGI